MAALRWLSALSLATGVRAQGSMHPDHGFPAGCDLTATGACAPSYAALQSAGELWKCPSGAKTSSSTWPTCVAGSGPNPLCAGELNASRSCCCPLAGCYAEPKFNTIVGVCKGGSCACGSNKTQAPSCAPEGDADSCSNLGPKACTGPAVPCCFGQDVSRLVPFYEAGTSAEINYLAAFEFDKSAKVWRRQDESSFNTDGKLPAYDLMKPQGGLGDQAWLAPQPGGSVFWSLGYYAAGVKGVGGDAMMFVLSTERWWGGTWYMLNQIELDRGPAAGYPAGGCATTNNNCWAAGNAGEMDFLEPAWQSGKASDVAVTSNYSASYSTQNNQVGRQFVGGVNSGGFASENYLLTSPPGPEAEPVVYVAVVDSVGNWVYRVPASRAAQIWPGIERKSIAATVQAAPSERPPSANPCKGEYCVVFTSNCQAKDAAEASAQGCAYNGDQGFCGNWMARLVDTKQPLVPSDACEKDVRGGKEMPWCKAMVGVKDGAEVEVAAAARVDGAEAARRRAAWAAGDRAAMARGPGAVEVEAA